MRARLQDVVGDNLRAYRLSRDLSQEAFADELGVHRTYAGGLERGEHNLRLRTLERLAGQLGLDPIQLLTVECGEGSP